MEKKGDGAPTWIGTSEIRTAQIARPRGGISYLLEALGELVRRRAATVSRDSIAAKKQLISEGIYTRKGRLAPKYGGREFAHRLDRLRPADAPVDLATCDLPVEAMWEHAPHLVTITARGKSRAIIELSNGDELTALLSDLRPADAPAPAAPPERIRVAQDAEGFWTCREAISGSPEYIRADLAPAPAAVNKPRLEAINAAGDVRAMMTFDDLPLCAGVAQTISEWADTDQKRRLRIAGVAPAPAAEAGEVERLRARVVQLESALGDYTDSHPLLREALASTAPSCPPGHFMIGDRAVPEPMREAPEVGEKYWAAHPTDENMTWKATWDGDWVDLRMLSRGLIHSTEAAARAHAEALIAPTKREG